jgi:integrase
MARPKKAVPGYSKHSASGQAVVYIDRRPVYLGKYGTPESRQRYADVIAGITARQAAEDAAKPAADLQAGLTVNELCLRFATEKLPKFKRADGRKTGEYDCFTILIRLMRELFGETLAAEFGPLKLRTLRAAMVDKDWSRRFINKQVGRVRQIFRFGVSWELVKAPVAAALKAVEALAPGDSAARETEAREAVPQEDIDATKKFLRQRNRDLVDLMLMTAARPSELLSLTTGMIERTGDVWAARLHKHKTAHRGHKRTLFFGAKAQAILLRYLDLAHPDRLLFPVGRKRFSEAVKIASIRAGVPPFTAHWLRHTAVTRFADEAGAEAAQRVAGHATISMTAHYSTAAQKAAREAVKKLG